MVHRDDLQKVLAKEAIGAGVEVQFDREVLSVDGDPASVTFADGSQLQADLLIGADGKFLQRAEFQSVHNHRIRHSIRCAQTHVPRP